MKIRSIDGSFAHEVSGLELWRSLSAQTVEAIRDAWSRHGVLVFRRQALSEEEYAAFGRCFGELDRSVRPDWGSAHDTGVIHISNLRNGQGESIGGLGAGEFDWHTDQSYVANPSTGSMLYMIEMPPAGGGTYWANLKLAWEALPEATKRRIEPLHVVYDYLLRQSTYDDEAPMSEELRRRTPPVSHPLVNIHPVTGERALYLDPVTAAGIEGWPNLMRRLVAACGQEIFREFLLDRIEPRPIRDNGFEDYGHSLLANAHFLAVHAEFLWQPNGLRAPSPK